MTDKCKLCRAPLTPQQIREGKEFCCRDCFLIYMEEQKNTLIYEILKKNK